MTLYDELFIIHDSLVANEIERTLEEYCKQSVFSPERVKYELERLCEEGDFFKSGNEYKVY